MRRLPVVLPPARLVAAAALVDDLCRPTQVLAARRTAPAHLAGRWEFPGGKVEPGETPEQAVCRELAEELGVTIRLGPPVGGRWALGRGRQLVLWLARIEAGTPRPLQDHDELRWLGRERMHDVPWLATNAAVVAHVADLLPRG